MSEQRERLQFQQSIDRTLSGLQDDPWLAEKVLSRAKQKGEYVVKRKLPLGVVFAIVLMLITITAVAVGVLSGKDFLNEYVFPVLDRNEGAQWGNNELSYILQLAEKHGVALDEKVQQELMNDNPAYKETLLRAIMSLDLGTEIATWPIEEQAWYNEQLFQYGLITEITRTIPTDGEITEQQALEVAAQYVMNRWNSDIYNTDLNARYVQYILIEGECEGFDKYWDIEFEKKDGTMYVIAIFPNGVVNESETATYMCSQQSEQLLRPRDEWTQEILSIVRQLRNDDFFTVENLAALHANSKEIMDSIGENSGDEEILVLKLLIQTQYSLPTANDITPNEAMEKAVQIAIDSGWKKEWLDWCKHSISYRNTENGNTYRVCFKLKANKRQVFYQGQMPFGIVIYISPNNGQVMNVYQLEELDEFDRYCEFPTQNELKITQGLG